MCCRRTLAAVHSGADLAAAIDGVLGYDAGECKGEPYLMRLHAGLQNTSFDVCSCIQSCASCPDAPSHCCFKVSWSSQCASCLWLQ
jgi:hypothetical protein